MFELSFVLIIIGFVFAAFVSMKKLKGHSLIERILVGLFVFAWSSLALVMNVVLVQLYILR